MKRKMTGWLAAALFFTAGTCCSQDIIITGPSQVNTNDVVYYYMAIDYNQNGNMCIYAGFEWTVEGGTILQQGSSLSSAYCQVRWDAQPGTGGAVKLWGIVNPPPPGHLFECPEGAYLEDELELTIGGPVITPLAQTAPYYNALPEPICVAMPWVTILSFQWRGSADGVAWTDIPGAVSQCLQPPGVTLPYYYSCVLQTSAGTFYSPAAFVDFAQLDPGAIHTQNPAPALAATVSVLSVLPATGGYCSGAYQYAWEQSVENGPWMEAGTGVSYPAPLTIIGKTLIRRKVTCGTEVLYSNTLVIDPAYAPGDPENLTYARETTVLKKGIVSWDQADALPVGDKLQSTTYLDGLGRPVQKVEKGISPAGDGTWKDIVTHYEYDAAGRIIKDFLPYASADNPGKFKSDAGYAQAAYIKTFYNESYFAATFTTIEYDNSPLNRVRKTTPPGAGWTGASVTTLDDFNKAEEKVHSWNLDYSSTALPVSSPSLVYATGTLARNTVTDENGNKVIHYTDLSGNLVLKKAQAADAGPPGMEHDGWVCTYYVYDDLGRLRYIIPDKAVAYMDDNGWDLTQALADELCFRYGYDKKGRLIAKKQPGAGEEKMIYDKKDRLVLTQHANQDRANNTSLAKSQWSFVLYDDLHRTVATGLLDNDASQAALQAAVDQLSNGMVTVLAFAGSGNVPVAVDNPVAGSSGSSGYLSGTSGIVFNSITHYDHYDYPGVKPFSNAHTLAYASSAPNIQPTVKTDRTTGMATGEKIRVLDGDGNSGNDKFLYTTAYYDEQGLPLETLADNGKMANGSGMDYQVSQYDFAGRLVSAYTSHSPDGSVTHTITARHEFDKAGRQTGLSKNFNNSFDKKLAKYLYDELGRLQAKRLAPGYTATGSGQIEYQVYEYNIRGLLTGINKDYALGDNNYTQWDQYFGLYLGYENQDGRFDAARLNGHITGMIWRSQGDNTPRKFDFTYDRLDRFASAVYKQRKKPSETSWSNAEADFSTYVEYEDGNGNIRSMKHMGIIPGVNNGVVVDDLRYAYLPTGLAGLSGNKLKQVDDLGALGANNGLLGDFRDANAGQDYFYDATGNLVTDLNKNIKNASANGITYNYLNKPEKIVIEGKSTIEFVYAATGEKLGKKVTYADHSVRTTTYAGDFIYEQFTPAAGGGDGEQLQYILHEEGRLKIIAPHVKQHDNDYELNAGSFGITSWPGGRQAVFEYFVRDHLGSTRMVLTEEAQKEYYLATMESGAAAQEEPLFGQVDAHGDPTAANELQKTRLAYSAPGVWPGNATDVVKLTASAPGKVMGPNMILKVMAGDIIHSHVNYYYLTDNAAGSGSNLLGDLVSSFTNALNGSKATLLGKSQSAAVGNELGANGGLTTFLQQHNGAGSTPKAYLNVVFLDEQFRFVEADPVTTGTGSRFKRVDGANDPGAGMSLQQKAPKNGWVFVFLSNESDEPVYFDNLAVVQEHGRIVQESHYYPFGQKIGGISSQAFNKLGSRYGYQGEFAESEEETGWDEFYLRMYDPQIGRWGAADPYDEFASGYIGMGNNPVSTTDPNGGHTDDWFRNLSTGEMEFFAGKYQWDHIAGYVWEMQEGPLFSRLLGQGWGDRNGNFIAQELGGVTVSNDPSYTIFKWRPEALGIPPPVPQNHSFAVTPPPAPLTVWQERILRLDAVVKSNPLYKLGHSITNDAYITFKAMGSGMFGYSKAGMTDMNGEVVNYDRRMSAGMNTLSLPMLFVAPEGRVANVAKGAPTIVGEGMKRVSMEAAKHPGSVILNNMPKFTGAPHQVTSQMMTYNRQWILQQMRSGRPILDIGLDPLRKTPSIFYQMEQNMMKNYLKLHPGAF